MVASEPHDPVETNSLFNLIMNEALGMLEAMRLHQFWGTKQYSSSRSFLMNRYHILNYYKAILLRTTCTEQLISAFLCILV